MDKHQEIYEKLIKTGWASWSHTKIHKCKFPLRNTFPGKVYPKPDFSNTKTIDDKEKLHGWNSWYYYLDNINEDIIKKEVRAIKNSSLKGFIEVIMIDDGWSKLGKWTPINKRFPDFQNLHKNIQDQGYKTGLWFAPFLADPKIDVLGRTNIEGIKIFGKVDNLFPYSEKVLDIFNEETLLNVKQKIISIAKECRLSVIKLDFLYAPYFLPQAIEDPQTCSNIIRKFIKDIKRETNCHIIGCGIAFFDALGTVDSCRISPDTLIPHLEHTPIIGKLVNNNELRKNIEIIEDRLDTKAFWTLDPDVFLYRKSLGLKGDLIQKHAEIIKKANGNIFLGDSITNMTKDEIENISDLILSQPHSFTNAK